MKITIVDFTEKGTNKKFTGVYKDDLWLNSTLKTHNITNKREEKLKKVKIKFTRDFSIGYSKEKREKLRERFALFDIYTVKNNAIQKEETGTKSTLGAYKGYRTNRIWINDVLSDGGYGIADDSDKIAKIIEEQYKQTIAYN